MKIKPLLLKRIYFSLYKGHDILRVI